MKQPLTLIQKADTNTVKFARDMADSNGCPCVMERWQDAAGQTLYAFYWPKGGHNGLRFYVDSATANFLRELWLQFPNLEVIPTKRVGLNALLARSQGTVVATLFPAVNA